MADGRADLQNRKMKSRAASPNKFYSRVPILLSFDLAFVDKVRLNVTFTILYVNVYVLRIGSNSFFIFALMSRLVQCCTQMLTQTLMLKARLHAPSPSIFIIVLMVTDCLTDIMDSEPILFVNVNLTETLRVFSVCASIVEQIFK